MHLSFPLFLSPLFKITYTLQQQKSSPPPSYIHPRHEAEARKESQAGTSSHRTGHKIASIVSVGANTGPAALLVYALSGSICQESCQGSGQESSVTANLQMRELPLMHIKPTPPARRISHPAFLVPGILIKRADRKPLSSPCR